MASVASFLGSTSVFLFFALLVVSDHQTASEEALDSESLVFDDRLSNVPAKSRAEFAATQVSNQDDVSNQTEKLRGKETEHRSPLPRYIQTLLPYHLKRSTHSPVCILFTQKDLDFDLEGKFSKLWDKLSTYPMFQNWKVGAYDVADGPLRGLSPPFALPSLRCYVGTAEPEDYSGRPNLKMLLQWFRFLAHKYHNRMMEANIDSLQKAASDGRKLTILAFPGEEKHFEIERMLLEFKSSHPSNLQLFIVHPGSANESSLQNKFNIAVEPTILALKKGDKRLRVLQRIEEPLVTPKFVEPFIISQTSPAVTLTVNNFQKEVFGGGGGGATPILVCFYTHWAEGVVPYLNAFVESVKAFKDHGAKLGFGIVDVEEQQDIVPRWVNARGIDGIPFILLFRRKSDIGKGKFLHQLALPKGANTLAAIESFLKENNVTLESVDGGPFHYPTWVASTFDMELSMGESSLIAPTCISALNTSIEGVEYIWGEGPSIINKVCETEDNTIIDDPRDAKVTVEVKDILSQKTSVSSCIGSIDRLTDATWSAVIEMSHAGMKPEDLQALMNIHKTSRKKDKPQTSLVFFIQDGCGSCRRQQAMFERVAEAVKFVDGGSAYILNCTSDPVTCDHHQVRGFPTVIAFRTFGQHSSERCLSPDHHEHTLRMDYHGLLQEKELMEWFSEVALPRVQIKTLQQIKQEQKHTNVILLATVYPLSLASQYLRSVGGVNSWYPQDCFLVACERLYGKARCYAAYGENIRTKDRERTSKEERLIVGKVEMLRQDGVSSKIITSGRSLIAALQAEADSQIHKFHTPHRYNLRSGQRCEDDHAGCTDLITEFVEDHSRLPVTHLTITSFHAYSSVGFDTKHRGSVFKSGLPVLIAFATREQMEEGAEFQQALLSSAYDLYQDLVFTWVDVEEFPRWVAQFVPVYYQRLILEHIDEITEEILPSLFVYPRLCLVRPNDHRHAAFFPSAKGFSLTSKLVGRTVDKDDILWFAKNFLKNPEEMLMETERF
ncbi:uncharacterized protein LOC129271073 [Lytechinus pictus]|uniref:uncharacterized protein LOC129271073 n=1 Tax=Lytechinus pictus TaxID=7653 RepID=UPI0030BA0824